MFSLMAGCCGLFRRRQEPARRVTLLMLGLDRAGKTAVLHRIQGKSAKGVLPTRGFSQIHLQQGHFEITVFDLGGAKEARQLWRQYYAECHGVIFVVDSSALSRMEEAQQALRQVLKSPKIAGKPVLLLANKQDREEALPVADLVTCLSLEETVNECKCPALIEPCAATTGGGKKTSTSIKKGLYWLLQNIEEDLDILNERNRRDTAKQKAQEEKQKLEGAERVRRIMERDDREGGSRREEGRSEGGEGRSRREEEKSKREEEKSDREEGSSKIQEGRSDGEEGSDTEGGSSDTEGGSSDTEGGSSDTEGGSSDTEGGSSDTEGGSSDTEEGSSDTEGGSSDTEGGSSDTEGGSSDTEEENSDTEEENSETEGGSSDTEGGSSDTEGGSSDTEGGSSDTEGGGSTPDEEDREPGNNENPFQPVSAVIAQKEQQPEEEEKQQSLESAEAAVALNLKTVQGQMDAQHFSSNNSQNTAHSSLGACNSATLQLLQQEEANERQTSECRDAGNRKKVSRILGLRTGHRVEPLNVDSTAPPHLTPPAALLPQSWLLCLSRESSAAMAPFDGLHFPLVVWGTPYTLNRLRELEPHPAGTEGEGDKEKPEEEISGQGLCPSHCKPAPQH